MIKIIDGDLLSSNADIIAHQVNCQGKMNSGIAKQIREKYPEVFDKYKLFCSTFINKDSLLGECQIVITHDGKCIANLFGQLGYGYDGKQYTDLDALEKSMLCFKSYFDKDKTIAFPYGLGSVRGGARFEDVYRIIDTIFDGYNVELWRLDKG